MDARWHYVVCLSTQHWMLWLPMWCQQHSLVHCSSHWSHSPLCILSEREVKNDTHQMHFWKLSKNRSQSRWMIILIPHNNSCALLVKDSITQSDFSFKWCCPTPLQLPIWKKKLILSFHSQINMHVKLISCISWHQNKYLGNRTPSGHLGTYAGIRVNWLIT